MASSSSVLSQTLQSITVTKIRELEKQRESYNTCKAQLLSAAEKESENARKRVFILLDGVRNLHKPRQGSDLSREVSNILRWLLQSVNDPSVLESVLLKYEDQLHSQLDIGSRKLNLAHLYSRLLTEWIEAPKAPDEPESDILQGSDSDDSFEMVQNSRKEKLEQLRDKFARVVFAPLQTDDAEIDTYLTHLFEGDKKERALERLWDEVSSRGKAMLTDSFCLNDQSLQWCIKALLKNDLLNDEKKASLNEFLKDDAVLGEIRDVLNMRFRDLKNWDWNLGDRGMPVVPRQSLNGKWRVMMDEDVLEALFSHWIGTLWAVLFKDLLQRLRRFTNLGRRDTYLPDKQRAKLQYYFEEWVVKYMVDAKNVEEVRQNTYRDDFFMAPLPSKLFEEAGGYDDDDERPKTDPSKKSPKDVKQLLLRTLATEVILRRSLDGEVAVVQSDFQWFATGIAHTSIFAVMRFVGFPEEWLTFFKKALEPPLNMLDGKPVRTRQRGLPMAHIFEKLLGELVLFFLDLAVAKKSSMLLYRFHDDLWLVGKPAQCAAAWRTMEDFAKIMGLEINKSKTGSVYLTMGNGSKIPMLPKTCQKQHVQQLQKQLADSTSVLQWIKTWNSCIGRFFSYTFGEPANCFGREHLDKILQTHRGMHRFLFNDKDTGTSVTEHVRYMISGRFQITDVPDAFIFMPESLGGIGLKNPFVGLFLLRKHLCEDPEARMHEFHEHEREQYQKYKKEFETLTEKERRRRYKAAFLTEENDSASPSLSWEDAQTFMTFEDFTAYRECTSSRLHHIYTEFLTQPNEDSISRTHRVKHGLEELEYTPEGLDGKTKDTTNAELLWTVQYFEDELFEKFGGLEVVDRGLLPLGVLKAMNARKVTWQMVL